ncbi:hypothetical protein [Streptomyces sp. NPDC048527]|uniref:hypothetical protein n=1 Tax=Streptomyces sp. NPDC048527 TaxID=3365568 RepID=UPI00372253DA
MRRAPEAPPVQQSVELVGHRGRIAGIAARMGNAPSPDRTRHLISPILFPTEDRPP